MSGDKVGYFDGAGSFAQGNVVQYLNSHVGGYGYGGGVCVAGGSVTLRNDLISGNTAGISGAWALSSIGYGGGIYQGGAGKLYLDSFTMAHAIYNADENGWSNWPPDRANISGGYILLPQIGAFTDSSNTVTSVSSLTLTASSITDGNASATISQVTFYYLDSTGTHHVLGNATQSSTGVWTLTITVNLTPGSYTLCAQAEDSSGLFSDPAALTLTVQ
jgi:hypothetical protein